MVAAGSTATPPLPSPASTASAARPRSITWFSPTAVRITRCPAAWATASIMLDVDRLVTTRPGRRRRRAAAASGSAYSSDSGWPASVTKAMRSPSTLRAAPRSMPAPRARTAAASAAMLATLGAGAWAKRPLGSSLMATSAHPSASRKGRVTAASDPLQKSTSTRSRRARMAGTSSAASRCSR